MRGTVRELLRLLRESLPEAIGGLVVAALIATIGTVYAGFGFLAAALVAVLTVGFFVGLGLFLANKELKEPEPVDEPVKSEPPAETSRKRLNWTRILRWVAVVLILGAITIPVIVFLFQRINNSPPMPVHSAFCIRQGISEESIANDGAEIEVQPEEPLILSRCTADGTPVSIGTCCWRSSSTGHIDNPDSCVDVIYNAPKSDPDILTLTVTDTTGIKQLSLTIIVKP